MMEQQRIIDELDRAGGEKLPDQPWHLHNDFTGTFDTKKKNTPNEGPTKLEVEQEEEPEMKSMRLLQV